MKSSMEEPLDSDTSFPTGNSLFRETLWNDTRQPTPTLLSEGTSVVCFHVGELWKAIAVCLNVCAMDPNTQLADQRCTPTNEY